MAEPAISDMWDYINEVLELESVPFNIKNLTTRKWYLQTLSMLFPFLSQEWNKIATLIQSEEAAINRMLLLLAQEGALPQEYLAQIKGHDVVAGDQETIMTLIQIIYELVEQALEEGEEGEEGEEEVAEGKKVQNHIENEEEEEEEEEDEEPSYANSDQRQHPKQVIRPQSPMTNARNDSEPQHIEKDPHSVLGIGNEFQQDHSDSMDHQYQLHSKVNQQPSTFKNPYSQMAPAKSYPMKETNFKEEEEDGYLNQKMLNKYKSEPQFKNLPKQQHHKQKKQKKQRALVAHPTMQKQFAKATTPAEKKLTRDVKTTISGSRKALEKENYNFGSPAAKDQVDRKKRELQYFASASKQGFNKKKNHASQVTLNKDKSIQKLKKLLKWKQSNLKRQQREIQQNLEMKVQLKKETYIKKINKLILNLEKQKMFDLKKQEKERQKHEKEMAERRLEAIEQQYRDQMTLLNSRGSVSKKLAGHTDHKSIIEGLQRQLKKQNEKQINSLKTRLRRQEAQLDDDLQNLQKQIIKAYKRN